MDWPEGRQAAEPAAEPAASPRQRFSGQLKTANHSGQQVASALGGVPPQQLAWSELLPEAAGASTRLSARRQAGSAEHRAHFFGENTFFADTAYHGPHSQTAYGRHARASSWESAQLTSLSPPPSTTSPQRAQVAVAARATASQLDLTDSIAPADQLPSPTRRALTPATHAARDGASVKELLTWR